MHPRIIEMVARLAPLAKKTLFRCNLTILAEEKRDELVGIFQAHRVGIIRSGRLVDVDSVAGLRSRSLRRVRIAFGEPAPGSELSTLEGVRIVEVEDSLVRLLAHGSARVPLEERP